MDIPQPELIVPLSFYDLFKQDTKIDPQIAAVRTGVCADQGELPTALGAPFIKFRKDSVNGFAAQFSPGASDSTKGAMA